MAEKRFPEDFLFGVGSSAYQVEGGAKADVASAYCDGEGESPPQSVRRLVQYCRGHKLPLILGCDANAHSEIWGSTDTNLRGKGESTIDRFVHTRSEHIVDRSTGDVACNTYKLFREDTALLTELGVTMFHWDLPQVLQDLGGWPNPIMADYFKDYARVLYERFGDRVKFWTTINEPRLYSSFAYGRSLPVYPLFAPGVEMPGIAEYLACHTLLLAHARAYHLYNDHYRESQKGQVGIVIDGFFYRPATDSQADKEAAERGLIFEVGWILHPILSKDGDYPSIMKETVAKNSIKEGRFRSRLPTFTPEEIKMLKGSADFVGLNHYTTYVVMSGECGASPSHNRDTNFIRSIDPASTALRYPSWLAVEPEGIRNLLCWIKENYGNPKIIITENGCGDQDTLEDNHKVEYHKAYLAEILKAVEEGCNVKGYIAWSFLDSFEWDCGFTERFGLYHVDFESPERTRTPKKSAQFFKEFLKTRSITST